MGCGTHTSLLFGDVVRLSIGVAELVGESAQLIPKQLLPPPLSENGIVTEPPGCKTQKSNLTLFTVHRVLGKVKQSIIKDAIAIFQPMLYKQTWFTRKMHLHLISHVSKPALAGLRQNIITFTQNHHTIDRETFAKGQVNQSISHGIQKCVFWHIKHSHNAK